MPVTAAICVPWRPTAPSRVALWQDRVQPHYAAMDLPLVTGDSDPERPFNRSQDRNRAAALAGDVDVYAFIDADTVVPESQLRAAIDLANVSSGAVYPFTRKLWDWGTLAGREDPERYHGSVVVPRYLFELVGGWDERLDGWGFEDGAFTRLLHLLGGRIGNVPGDAYIYNHERTPEETLTYWADRDWPDLMDRYDAVRTVPAAYAMAADVRASRGLA
jgi:hypothetical protein